MVRRPTLALTLLLAVFACASGCGKGEAATHESGQATEARIVALSPAIAVILQDLDLGDRIVGRHAFDMASPPEIAVVGDQAGIDYEALARLRPTHVLLEWGARELPARLTDLASTRDWTVRTYTILTLDDIRRTTSDVASLIGDDAAQRRAAVLHEQMDRAWAARDGVADKAGRTLILFGSDPGGAAGPGSFHVQLLEAVGGRNAIPEGKPFVVLDAEDARRLDPDSVVIFAPAADPSRLKELLGPLAPADLRALREGRVGVVTDPLCLTPSTAMIRVADDLARLIGSW